MKLFIFFALFLSLNTFSQDGGRKFNFFKNQKTTIKNPFELRDPFKRPKNNVTSSKRNQKKKGAGFSNVPSLDGVPLSQIRVVGILLGDTRRAVAKISTGSASAEGDEKLSEETYILKEGMTLGENQAEIKAILPGGVVLVEKLRNVYDQDEYLETILPLQSTN